MEEHQVGWIAAIIIGGIAGWLAEQFMKSNMGLLMNIVLGIIGAAVARLAVGLPRYLARRVDRLSSRWVHRSLHPDRDSPPLQRWPSANINWSSAPPHLDAVSPLCVHPLGHCPRLGSASRARSLVGAQ